MDPKRLRSVPLFEGLSKKELGQPGKWTDEIDVEPGDHLTSQGALAYEFFVIEQGTADVVQGDDHMGTLGPGDFFGEIGLIQSGRQTASVSARRRCIS